MTSDGHPLGIEVPADFEAQRLRELFGHLRAARLLPHEVGHSCGGHARLPRQSAEGQSLRRRVASHEVRVELNSAHNGRIRIVHLYVNTIFQVFYASASGAVRLAAWANQDRRL